MAKGIILRKLQYMPINSHGKPTLLDAQLIEEVRAVTDTKHEHFGKTMIRLRGKKSRYTLETVKEIQKAWAAALSGTSG